jgi:hypothetical protein
MSGECRMSIIFFIRREQMDTSSLGKWAWLIGLVVLVVWSGLAALVTMPDVPYLADVALLLAFLGGIFYLSGMKDRTGFFIAAAALGWFAAGAGGLFVAQLGGLVAGLLGGAAAAAAAGAAGVLLMVVYEWIMSFSSSK